MSYATYNINHKDNFRIRCFKCGSYDTYIESDQGDIQIICDECENQEDLEFDFEED